MGKQPPVRQRGMVGDALEDRLWLSMLPGDSVSDDVGRGGIGQVRELADERVEDEAGGAGPASRHQRGYGLIGMRERAQMIGATFDAGPTSAGGWRVSLRLPLDRETAETAIVEAHAAT